VPRVAIAFRAPYTAIGALVGLRRRAVKGYKDDVKENGKTMKKAIDPTSKISPARNTRLSQRTKRKSTISMRSSASSPDFLISERQS